MFADSTNNLNPHLSLLLPISQFALLFQIGVQGDLRLCGRSSVTMND